MQSKQEGSKSNPPFQEETRYSDRADEDDFNEAESSTARAPTRKTREELNEIEKQRTKRINAQILSLKGLLEMSNVRTRKDKFSILNSAYDYIMRLKNAMQQIKDRLNNGELVGAVSENGQSNVISDGMEVMKVPDLRAENSELLLRHASVPMALMSLDAKFISCNSFFSEMTGYSNHELITMSLFNLAGRDEMKELFSSIGNLIEHNDSNARHFWKKFQFQQKEVMCFTSFWIVNNEQGIPAYIQLMLMSLDGCIVSTSPNATTTSHAISSTNAPIRNIGNVSTDNYTPKSFPISQPQSHSYFDQNTSKPFHFQPSSTTQITNSNPMSFRSQSLSSSHSRMLGPTPPPPPASTLPGQPVEDEWMIHSLMQMKGNNKSIKGFMSSSNSNNNNNSNNGNAMSLSSSSQLHPVGGVGLFHNPEPSPYNNYMSNNNKFDGNTSV